MWSLGTVGKAAVFVFWPEAATISAWNKWKWVSPLEKKVTECIWVVIMTSFLSYTCIYWADSLMFMATWMTQRQYLKLNMPKIEYTESSKHVQSMVLIIIFLVFCIPPYINQKKVTLDPFITFTSTFNPSPNPVYQFLNISWNHTFASFPS